MPSQPIDQVLAQCGASEQRNLDDLFSLVRQPSISTQGTGVLECAALVHQLFADAGFETQLLETPDFPMVFAQRCPHPDRPTLLVYGHYDVQPPDPLDLWTSPPFEPTIRDGRIYARGVGDNKGQFFAQLCGARAWLESVGELPVNLKFLIEGEEENGSPHLDSTVARHRDLLAADLVYTSDGPVIDDNHPAIEYGVRGVLSVELRVKGASTDLHSGNWGGVAPNAAWMLVDLLATMRRPDGTITIDGFMDDVAPMTPLARAAADAIPLDQQASLRSIGIEQLPPPDGLPYFDRLMARPTLTINGITSGYGGPGGKTVIPSRAIAKLDMRLVPSMRAEDIFQKIVAHVAKHAPGVEVIHQGAMEPSNTPLEHPLAEPVRRAVARGFGQQPIDIPMLGGSLPDSVWTRTLGLPSFLVPLCNSDERNHAPDENMEVWRFHAGARTLAALLWELSGGDA